MSYQVLARKWRPQRFSELVGQQHVLQALQNALDKQRLHHAYLFTGTRGVGKTTLARLFAKALNCEQGVSANPCGQCTHCLQIQQGNFIDLLEIDAASRTKVEDTRELLDDVPYRPTQGRYKVYLIDEVHMLSGHSFNALLKTLEEPPEHVKFLLATTDPQKLPVTILSRCLQFHLKSMSVEQTQQHLAAILQAEQIPFELEALRLLAQSGQGSMRDALSLTEQAVAFGQGKLEQKAVAELLGLAANEQLYQLIDALAQQDAARLMQLSAELALQATDFNRVLADLLSLLHRLTVIQALGQVVAGDWDAVWLQQAAQSLLSEELQLYYQIALQGRRDLAFAPDGRCGFEMTLLRMLAFRPVSGFSNPQRLASASAVAKAASAQIRQALEPSVPPVSTLEPLAVSASATTSAPEAVVAAVSTPEPLAMSASATTSVPEAVVAAVSTPESLAMSASATTSASEAVAAAVSTPEPLLVSAPAATPAPQILPNVERSQPRSKQADFDWPGLVQGLKLPPLVRKLADHCRLVAYQAPRLALALDPQQQALWSAERQAKLQQALSLVLAEPLKLDIQIQAIEGETPFERAQQNLAQQQDLARSQFAQDPAFAALRQEFAAEVDEASLTLNSESMRGGDEQ